MSWGGSPPAGQVPRGLQPHYLLENLHGKDLARVGALDFADLEHLEGRGGGWVVGDAVGQPWTVPPHPATPARAQPSLEAPPTPGAFRIPHLAIATLAQDAEQLEAVGPDELRAVVDAARRDLDLLVMSHRPVGTRGDRGWTPLLVCVPPLPPPLPALHLLQAVAPGLQLHLLQEGTHGQRWAPMPGRLWRGGHPCEGAHSREGTPNREGTLSPLPQLPQPPTGTYGRESTHRRTPTAGRAPTGGHPWWVGDPWRPG